jgi:hypothetical protein
MIKTKHWKEILIAGLLGTTLPGWSQAQMRDEKILNLTLYGEFEDLNGAALYKMEIAGFGSGDLTESLALARKKHR